MSVVILDDPLPPDWCDHLLDALAERWVPADHSSFVAQFFADRALSDRLVVGIDALDTSPPSLSYWSCQALRYVPGDRFGWHTDRCDTEIHRDIAVSACVQLSEPADYAGGAVQFQRDELVELPRAKGTIAVFDSTVHHRVLEVTGGNRYSITCFGLQVTS